MPLDPAGLEAAAKVLAFRDLAADPDWHGVYEEEWAAQPEEYREAWRESVREVLAPYLAAVVPVTCPECGTEVPPRYSPEASGWYCGGCARPVARDPVPVTPTTENPTARQVLAEAFDGVIHHACGPDDWAAGHALDALAAAGFSVVAGRAAATPGPRCGNCGHVSFLAAATHPAAASPDERLREALERIVDLPLVDDSDADRMREIAAEALPWKPGSDDPR